MKMDMETQAHSETPASAEPVPDSPTSSPLVFTGSIFRVRQGKGTAFQRSMPKKRPEKSQETNISTPEVAVPISLAYTLAFAHHMENLISSGEVKDRAELARIFGLSRARVTQILDLTLLAPDIQEDILFMEGCREPQAVSERTVRPLARTLDWRKQKELAVTLKLEAENC